MDENNQLIMGWDTAPHHTQLKNFPYHKHVGRSSKIESSIKMSLDKVLSYIEKKIKKV
ncbi:MAG: DUF6516 family protein [bacterium]